MPTITNFTLALFGIGRIRFRTDAPRVGSLKGSVCDTLAKRPCGLYIRRVRDRFRTDAPRIWSLKGHVRDTLAKSASGLYIRRVIDLKPFYIILFKELFRPIRIRYWTLAGC